MQPREPFLADGERCLYLHLYFENGPGCDRPHRPARPGQVAR
jgi:hypothetical protein